VYDLRGDNIAAGKDPIGLWIISKEMRDFPFVIHCGQISLIGGNGYRFQPIFSAGLRKSKIFQTIY
jgi:hypothetical protein